MRAPGIPTKRKRKKCAAYPRCPDWTCPRGKQNKILKVSDYEPSKNKIPGSDSQQAR